MEVSSQMSNHRIFKRQKRTVGSIVKIPLEGGYHTYARILKDGRIEEATLEQCRGLESVSVWPPEAMEVRLNDYYAGRLNYHVVKMMYPELSYEEIKKRIAESSNKSAKKETVPQTKKIAAA